MYLDILIGVVVLLTVLKGYSNGFFLSAISLFGIVVNVVAAKLATPKIMGILNISGGSNDKTYILSYTFIFLGMYVLIGLLLAFLKSFIKSSMRSFTDVFLGIIFGFIKGILISFILLLFFNLLGNHLPKIEIYGEGSYSNRVFKKTVPYLRDYFPEKIGDKIEKLKYKESVERYLDDVLKESGE